MTPAIEYHLSEGFDSLNGAPNITLKTEVSGDFWIATQEKL